MQGAAWGEEAVGSPSLWVEEVTGFVRLGGEEGFAGFGSLAALLGESVAEFEVGAPQDSAWQVCLSGSGQGVPPFAAVCRTLAVRVRLPAPQEVEQAPQADQE